MSEMDWGCVLMQNISIKMQSVWLCEQSFLTTGISTAHEVGMRLFKGRRPQTRRFHLYSVVFIFLCRWNQELMYVPGTITAGVLYNWTDSCPRWERRCRGFTSVGNRPFPAFKGRLSEREVVEMAEQEGKGMAWMFSFLPPLSARWESCIEFELCISDMLGYESSDQTLIPRLRIMMFCNSGDLSHSYKDEMFWQDIEFRHADVDD